MLRNVIRALYLVISWGRPSRWLLCCEDVACLLELANHYLLAYIAFLETTKIGFRIRHAASECVCVCVCICDFNFLTCWRIFINSLISFHSKTPYSSNVFFFPVPPLVLSDFVVSPSPPPLRLRLNCNRLLRLGRPVGAVTLSRWEWWWDERWIWGARGGLNLISTNYRDHGHHGRLPLSRKNAHGRAGNRTRDLMVSSQELWPPSQEAGPITLMLNP